jgi:imidazoleglycerol-phosphate dehydratase/histidinol-phosphatase
MGLKKYLFIDRDGTLIKEPSDFQVDSLSKLQFTENVIPSLLTLKSKGFHFIMITNQDGLGTKSFPQQDFEGAHNLMLDIFTSQGIIFEETLICPHFETDNCLCRKPHLGLVRELIAYGEIDFQNSYVIGDRKTDITLGENMGIGSFLFGDESKDDTVSWAEIVSNLCAKNRQASIKRNTKETKIVCDVNLDNNDLVSINTGIGFFDHMLEQIARHSGVGINLSCIGDLHVDQHHCIEDIGITLGSAFKQALGEKHGIQRYGFVLPMDETLCQVAIDLSGRGHLEFSWNMKCENIGTLSSEMVPHFFKSFAESLGATIHIDAQGKNSHHIVESIFKAVAKTLGQALTLTSTSKLPSTKGIL